MTEDEYLAHERTAERKSEYVDGQIVAMAGASLNHGQIVSNFVQFMGPQMRRHNCRTLTNDVMVCPTASRYYYPDIVIVCGTPQIGECRRRDDDAPAV